VDAGGSGGRLRPPALPFRDRAEAAEALAGRLAEGAVGPGALVLAIPRGGVPVGAVIAGRLGLDLDVIVAHKLGAPGNPEFAVGAATADGTVLVEPWARGEPGVDEAYLRAETERQIAAARVREARLRGGRPPCEPAGRTVIIVDDGIATGATVRAAVRSARAHGAARVIVAAPVAARESAQRLEAEADEVVVLAMPDPFFAVGLWYRHFDPVDDDAVAALLADAAAARPSGAAP
jgi:predicted phosphoribosyltransferase